MYYSRGFLLCGDVQPGCHWEAFLHELFSSARRAIGTGERSVRIVRTHLKEPFTRVYSKYAVLTPLAKPQRIREMREDRNSSKETPFSLCVGGKKQRATQRTPAILGEFSTVTHGVT